MKFVHAADLHLDSPLRGLARYEGAPVDALRGATRRAFDRLIELCEEEGAAFLLLAGDLFDGDWRDWSTGLFFCARMARLQEAGVRVLLVRGNHDAASRLSRGLPLPANVTEFATRRPQTVCLDDVGVAVHGQGFASRAVTEDLAAGYPDAVAGLLNVGLLHTCLDGRAGHEPYAPTSAAVLATKGYDYWALGHVHRREVVAQDPWIVFPGNLQGRHVRETGAKGATVVTVDGGRVAAVEHRPLDVVRWYHLEVDVTGLADEDAILGAVSAALAGAVEEAAERTVAARVTLAGATPCHARLHADPERFENAVRSVALPFGDAVWVEVVRARTRAPLDLPLLRSRHDPIGHLARTLEHLRTDDAALALLRAVLGDLERKLPREAREGPDGLSLEDPAVLREALEDVERLLLPRLLEAEGA